MHINPEREFVELANEQRRHIEPRKQTARERAASKWAIGHTMYDFYASQPDRRDDDPEFHDQIGHIVLGYN